MYTYEVIVTQLRLWMPLLVLGTGAYFARRLLRALERRAEAGAELLELRARVAELEAAQEATSRDVMRLQAGQEFATQLLGTRIAHGATRPQRESNA